MALPFSPPPIRERLRVGLLGSAPPGARSGTVNALEQTAVQLKRLGIDVVRLVSDPTTGQDPAGIAQRSQQACEALERFRPHVLWVETVDGVIMEVIDRMERRDVPTVLVYHEYHRYEDDPTESERVRARLYELHRQVAVSVVENRRQFADLDQAEARRIVTLSRGIDLEQFSPLRRDQALRDHWGARASDLVIASVGRLMPQKGPELLIETLTAVQHSTTQSGRVIRAVVVGDGPERARLAQAMPWVVFTGQLTGDALAAAYASADLFLQPSPYEGFMMTAIEAQASGVPVIVLDHVAARDQMDASATVIADDSRAFVTATLRLIEDPHERQRLSQAGRLGAARWSWPVVAKRFVDVLMAANQEHVRCRLAALPESTLAADDPMVAVTAALNAEQRGDWLQAIAHHRSAVAAMPLQPQGWANLGPALASIGELDAADYALRRAEQLDKNLLSAQVNLGLLDMLRGRWRSGWPRFGQLRLLGEHPAEQWNGQVFSGHLVVYADGGLGDTVQFLRFVPLAIQRAGAVTVVVQPALVWLAADQLATCRIEPRRNHLPKGDAYMPLSWLGGVLKAEPSILPVPLPPPLTHSERSTRWATHLNPDGRLRVGLCWQGDQRGTIDFGRSLSPGNLEALSQVRKVRWLSLQRGPAREVAKQWNWLEDPGDDFDADGHAFSDTCAAMEHLDLIITTDTSIAHVAGMMRRPTWLLLQHVPDWRWLLDREDTPWYPTLRLFRQKTAGDWPAVIARVVAELAALTNQCPAK